MTQRAPQEGPKDPDIREALLPKKTDDPELLAAQIRVMNAYNAAALGFDRPGSITDANREWSNTRANAKRKRDLDK